MALVLGVELETCEINLKRQSRQSFGIDWFNDLAQSVPSDLTGVTFRIALGNRDAPHHVWIGVNNSNRTVWTIDEEDSDLPLNQYGGVLVMNDGSGDILLFRVQADVED